MLTRLLPLRVQPQTRFHHCWCLLAQNLRSACLAAYPLLILWMKACTGLAVHRGPIHLKSCVHALIVRDSKMAAVLLTRIRHGWTSMSCPATLGISGLTCRRCTPWHWLTLGLVCPRKTPPSLYGLWPHT